VYIRGGYNIHPVKVEQVIAQSLSWPKPLTRQPSELRTYVAGELADYKAPDETAHRRRAAVDGDAKTGPRRAARTDHVLRPRDSASTRGFSLAGPKVFVSVNRDSALCRLHPGPECAVWPTWVRHWLGRLSKTMATLTPRRRNPLSGLRIRRCPLRRRTRGRFRHRPRAPAGSSCTE
jgi:hypothetical protein